MYTICRRWQNGKWDILGELNDVDHASVTARLLHTTFFPSYLMVVIRDVSEMTWISWDVSYEHMVDIKASLKLWREGEGRGMKSVVAQHARDFARTAHRGQVRKFNQEPYYNHVEEVAFFVANVTDDSSMIAAAFLHDVVEDCDVTLYTLVTEFGGDIAKLVDEVTDRVKHGDPRPRAERKAIEREHLAQASPRAQTIKLADLKSNTTDILTRAPEFAKTYMPEKRALLEVMRLGDPLLYGQCWKLVLDYEATRA